MAINKNILVVSHERSGTHFLINTIALNLGFKQQPFNLGADNNKRVFDSLQQADGSGMIVKSHHQRYFFDGCEDLLKRFIVLVVFRDVRDVLTSMWHYYRQVPDAAFPKARTVRELAFNVDPTQYPSGHSYFVTRSTDYVTRWMSHVDSWIGSPDIIPVLYHELFDRFDFTARVFLRELSGEEFNGEIVRPTFQHLNVCGWKGGNGKWREFLSEEDSGRILSKLSPHHKGLLVG